MIALSPQQATTLGRGYRETVERVNHTPPVTVDSRLRDVYGLIRKYEGNPQKHVFRGYASFKVTDVKSLMEEIADLRAQLKVIEPTPPPNARQEPRKVKPQKVVVSDATLKVMCGIGTDARKRVPTTWLTVAEYAKAHGKSKYTVYDWKRTGRIDWRQAEGRKGIEVKDMLPRPGKRGRKKKVKS